MHNGIHFIAIECMCLSDAHVVNCVRCHVFVS